MWSMQVHEHKFAFIYQQHFAVHDIFIIKNSIIYLILECRLDFVSLSYYGQI